MPHKLLEHKETVKKTSYHPCELIVNISSSIGEMLKVSDITWTLYTQHQAINIDYMIIQRVGKFGLSIRKWNWMPTVHKTWVRFK